MYYVVVESPRLPGLADSFGPYLGIRPALAGFAEYAAILRDTFGRMGQPVPPDVKATVRKGSGSAPGSPCNVLHDSE